MRNRPVLIGLSTWQIGNVAVFLLLCWRRSHANTVTPCWLDLSSLLPPFMQNFSFQGIVVSADLAFVVMVAICEIIPGRCAGNDISTEREMESYEKT